MDNRRIFGVLLLVLGVGRLTFGTDATQSAMYLSQRFQIRPSEKGGDAMATRDLMPA